MINDCIKTLVTNFSKLATGQKIVNSTQSWVHSLGKTSTVIQTEFYVVTKLAVSRDPNNGHLCSEKRTGRREKKNNKKQRKCSVKTQELPSPLLNLRWCRAKGQAFRLNLYLITPELFVKMNHFVFSPK